MIEECMYFGEVYFIIQNIDRCINFKCFKFFDKKFVVGYSCFCIFFWLFNVKIIFKIILVKNGIGSFNNF